MRLEHITFTGIDAKTDMDHLIEIQRRYPIAEFGVLTSYHWYKNGNRYLGPRKFRELIQKRVNLALHICGSAATDAARGEWSNIFYLTWGTNRSFRRIQLNLAERNDRPPIVHRGGNPRGGNPRGGNPRGGNPRGGIQRGGIQRGSIQRGGNPRGGNPRGGNPRGGNPRGGNPRGGNPRGGNPRGGNPRGGNPRGGNLRGGNLRKGPPTHPFNSNRVPAPASMTLAIVCVLARPLHNKP